MSNAKRPFQNLGKAEIQNLGLAAVFALYLAFFGWILAERGLGGDYLAYWSGGYIANTQGYAAIYDIENMENLQRVMVGMQDPSLDFSPLPLAILPVFMLPMQVLAWLPPMSGFWLWRLANLALFLIYMRFFISKINPPLPKRNLVILMLSFPVFLDFREGQISTWLVVFSGEFLRTYLARRYFLSGMWLGGLLLKPQTLILILPALLLRRLWKTLGGFSLSAALLAFISLTLSGWGGILGVFRIWTTFAEGIPTNSPERMVNWRMLGILTEKWLSPTWGEIITYTGMLLTALWVLLLWYRWHQLQSKNMLLLCTFAATLMVTWHSHIHMGMLLIPAIALGIASGEISDRVLNIWLFLLPIALLATFIIGLVTHNPQVLMPGQSGSFLMGLSGLLVNLVLMLYAAKNLQSKRVNL